MGRTLLGIAMAAMVALSACSGGGAEQLFETAKLEELQNNREDAAALYREIVTKYPQSEYARQAQERLAELQKGE